MAAFVGCEVMETRELTVKVVTEDVWAGLHVPDTMTRYLRPE
jgi:hypothetical protein